MMIKAELDLKTNITIFFFLFCFYFSQIPIFAGTKIWKSVLSPFIFNGSSQPQQQPKSYGKKRA